MERIIRAALVVALSRLLTACDPIYGISRLATLPSTPPLPCVEAAIRSVAGVEGVRSWSDQGGRPLTLTGLKPPDQLHYFGYEVNAAVGTLYIRVNYKGEVELSQHLVRVGIAPPQRDIDAVRPAMLRIEETLQTQCGVTLPSGSIQEYCSGVDCDAE